MTRERRWIEINRAPVLTLWAAVVAQRAGFTKAEALTLGRAVAGLNAYSKGRSLGIFKPGKGRVAKARNDLKTGSTIHVDLLNRAVPVRRYREGIRALSKGKPVSPQSVEEYLEERFGDRLADVRKAMMKLARSRPPGELQAQAYHLYEQFRPQIPGGKKGWGARGRLSLGRIRALADRP